MRLHNMLKYVGILGVLVFCTACGTGQQTENKTETGSGEDACYPGSEGITAVTVQDSMLTNCYTLKEENAKNVSAGNVTPEAVEDKSIAAGDIILFLHEDTKNPDIVHVMLPYGDTPYLYGYLSKESLSTDVQEIQNANQAIVYDCDAFDKADGTKIGTMNGTVRILNREDTWCQVELLGTGESSAWVRTDALAFDFDQSVVDIDQGAQ